MNEIKFLDLEAQQLKIKSFLNKKLNSVLKNSNFIMGPEVKELESKLEVYTKAKYCVTCGSGTDALILCLLALKIGKGDKVICPSFTFPATAESILITGAEPIFVDVSSETFNICYQKTEEILSKYKKSKSKIRAIIAVDLFGLPANYKKLKKIAKEYDLSIISDAAQSFGASFYGEKVGAINDISCTSFFPAKPLGCYGDGGAIFVKNNTLKLKLESLRAHGKSREKYKITDIGLNSRLDTLQAAVLIAKMNIIEWEIKKRNALAKLYVNELHNYFEVPIIPKETNSAWAQFTLKSKNRNKVIAFLKEKNIPAAIYYPIPMHLQPAYKKFNTDNTNLGVSEKLSKSVFSIPIHPYINSDQKELIIQTLKRATEYL